MERRFGMGVLPADAYELAWCRGCGTLYVDCDVTDEYLESLYRNESIEWQKAVLEAGGVTELIGGSRLPEFRSHWDDITSVRAPSDGEQLLDFGCQTGEFGSVAMRDGVVPNGIELSPDYAHKAQAAWGAQSKVVSEPLDAGTFAGRAFQYVTAFETLEHMRDPRSCLKTLRGLIATDGVLALSVPSTHYFWFKFKALHALRAYPSLFRRVLGRRAALYSSQILPHTHLYNFTPSSVAMLLGQAGYRTVSVRAVGWAGRSTALARLCNVIMATSGGRVGMAPSVFAIARPK
ncbi:MAG TPA: class I SAM-dependent methyltransferase [Burkholderiaceae bacterium]|nr:class I SAM-dependent methyltransferase [Burkholderiaceae bacterium]